MQGLGTDGGTAGDPKVVSTEPVQVTYTALGALKTLSDGQGHLTRYDYDALGRLSQIVRPGANETSHADVVRFTSYSNDGQVLQSINGRGWGRHRRLSRDYEQHPDSSRATLQVASIHRFLRRLKPAHSTDPPFRYRNK